MDVPGLGEVTRDDRFGWYISDPVPVPVLGGKRCRFVLAVSEDDTRKDEFHVAIANFLSAAPSILQEVEADVYRYYQDTSEYWEDGEWPVHIDSASDVWAHIQFGEDAVVERRSNRDQKIYISLECECAWEAEHGLQIVFQNGLRVNKVGMYDGHLTNSDACDDECVEDVVYVSPLDC